MHLFIMYLSDIFLFKQTFISKIHHQRATEKISRQKPQSAFYL